MGKALLHMLTNQRGSAATEMVLSLPLLLVLLFGSTELGNYFLSEHKVIKAVRDGARYAARRPFSNYAGCMASSTVIDETRNVTRTGQVATGGSPRVVGWTNPTSVSVNVTCDNSGTYSGIYTDASLGAPVITVTAVVPYTPVLGRLGLTNSTLTLRATSEAAVTGI